MFRPRPIAASACPATSRRGGRAFACVAALLIGARAAAAGDLAAAVKSPTAPDGARATVPSVVAGIVSYTRWPGELRTVRLCTVGQGRGVDELLSMAELGSPVQSVPVRATAAGSSPQPDCDAVYVGSFPPGATRDLLQAASGRPVLMIGEGQEFCSDGGMFCLQPGTVVRFAVNLDAIARSGLRVNPWVLRIARHAPAASP